MESDHEQSVIAPKIVSAHLGFDKNDPQRTIDQNRSSANLAVSKINTHLFTGESTKWEEAQLFYNLQEIIAKHRAHFNGEPVLVE